MWVFVVGGILPTTKTFYNDSLMEWGWAGPLLRPWSHLLIFALECWSRFLYSIWIYRNVLNSKNLKLQSLVASLLHIMEKILPKFFHFIKWFSIYNLKILFIPHKLSLFPQWLKVSCTLFDLIFVIYNSLSKSDTSDYENKCINSFIRILLTRSYRYNF